jgi:hypothetical protein
MNYQNIISTLNQLSTEELSRLNVDLVDLIKFRRKQTANSVKRTLTIGAHVKVNHPKAKGKTYQVDKINKLKVILSQVDSPNTVQIVAPLSLIETI